MNEDTSWYHRFRLWLGDTFVEEDELLPVMRNGRIHSFRGPGYHRKARFWQSYGKPTPVAPRYPELTQVPVNTADGLLVSIDATISYTFDPRQCRAENLSGTLNPYSRDALVKVVAHRAIRLVCGQYLEEKLVCGRVRHHAELQIGTWLKQQLKPFGIVINEATAVDITRITPPAAIAKERIEAQCRAIYTSSVNQQPYAISAQLHEQTLAQNSGQLNLTIIKSSENVSLDRQNVLPISNLSPSPNGNGHLQNHQKEIYG
jgi:regulator of protease activity HflC (stomatin/prohibitin superfamily)